MSRGRLTMSASLTLFLDLTSESETGEDLVDHFHLNAVQEPDGAVKHVNDGSSEIWRREAKPLGTGGFGTAWLEREDGGKTRVVKEVSKFTPRVEKRYWVRELLSMALLSKNKTCYPEFYGWFQDESHVYIAMEHFAFGDLQGLVSNQLPHDQASLVVAQICTALEVMHRRRITHRDLKPANILVRHPPPRWQVAVSDFGVSKRVRGATTALHTSFEGDFMAPEILGFVDDGTSGEYTSAVDMWSLGCIAYWLLKSELPVPRRKMMAYCSRPWPDAAKNIEMTDLDEASQDFILALLKPDPQQRTKASAACAHDWLQGESKGAAVSAPSNQRKRGGIVTCQNPSAEEVHKGPATSQILRESSQLADATLKDPILVAPTQINAIKEGFRIPGLLPQALAPIFDEQEVEPELEDQKQKHVLREQGFSRKPGSQINPGYISKYSNMSTLNPRLSCVDLPEGINTVMGVVSHNIRKPPSQKVETTSASPTIQRQAQPRKELWTMPHGLTSVQLQQMKAMNIPMQQQMQHMTPQQQQIVQQQQQYAYQQRMMAQHVAQQQQVMTQQRQQAQQQAQQQHASQQMQMSRSQEPTTQPPQPQPTPARQAQPPPQATPQPNPQPQQQTPQPKPQQAPPPTLSKPVTHHQKSAAEGRGSDLWDDV